MSFFSFFSIENCKDICKNSHHAAADTYFHYLQIIFLINQLILLSMKHNKIVKYQFTTVQGDLLR